nr:hypothetical protein [uncultured Allomuricauda sp.]|tara:strand:+ start:1127 stop:1666 length:540 start_codon:yes stop_codon:yes gene_type:complete
MNDMETTNYIKHLNRVLELFLKDSRLNPTHISLYMGLFQLWNNQFFREEFHIDRGEVMLCSKIGSKSTYHRCIKQLSHWGYLLYIPSHNPFKGSKVRMFDFGTTPGQGLYPDPTHNGTANGQAVVPKIKHIQTRENHKNQDKRENENFLEANAHRKPLSTGPYRDNLRTTKEKDYNEPL